MASHPIRFGIQTGQQSLEWAQLLALWQKADAWGYDSLWNFDHFYPIFVDPEGPCLESWTTLAALAQATRRARVGRSEEHTSELQSHSDLVCRLLLEKKKNTSIQSCV